MPLPQVRVFTLAANENSEGKLYRLEKGWILRFVLGPSLMAADIRLFCNHPSNSETPYKRSHYTEVEWKNTTGVKGDRTDLMAEIKMVIAGSFNFFFTTDKSGDPDRSNGSGYFLVDPTLHIGPNDDEIGMDGIACQTVITKLLGPFDEWMGRLQVSSESGYNMVHFTPINELGISNSAYSIRDQLRLSPVYSPGDKKYSLNDVEALVKRMNKDYGLMSMSDLVYNHTAKDSPWVLEHPECTFNLENSPHLRPAYVVDRIFENFSLEVSKGLWEKEGIPVSVNSEDHLRTIDHILRHNVFPMHRIHEFYVVSVDTILKDFRKAVNSNLNGMSDVKEEKLKIIQDSKFRRFKSTVDLNLVVKLFNTDRPGVFSRADRVEKCCEALTGELNTLNSSKEREILDHVNVAISNFIANVRWRFINPGGPKLPEVTPDEPLMFGYFVIPKSHEGGVEKEEKISLEEGQMVMAVNGWVMGDDPLSNFAEPGRNVYLRRELIAWGDSVKLNFGKSPKDCPYLWQRMEEYTRQSARIFQGLRLDNCHSTPIHVAAHMLDIAREIRPDLYLIAELFTGNEYLDNLFMNHLGINSLVRESLTAWNSHEQGRLIHRFGGQPVGAFIQPRVQPLVPCMAHALFYDQTHDNECPIDKRSAYDSWPTAAMVSITNCAIGSNRGYDQMVPHHINVVKEERLYPSWLETDNPDRQHINSKFGITAGKRALNALHVMLANQGFSQVFVDQVDPDTVSITRHNPQTHDSVVLIVRTAFSHPANPNDTGGHIRPVHVQGKITQVILEGRMRPSEMFAYKKDSDFINGLPNYYLDLKEKFPVQESQVINVTMLENGERSEISFKNLTPGSVVAVRCSLVDKAKHAILEIRRGLGQFGYMMRSYSGRSMFSDEDELESNFRAIVSKLTLADLNRVLYRVNQEERDDGYGFGAYNIPNSGDMLYCGLRGILSLMSLIRPNNDLGHPLCTNLRDGDWLVDYIANRLLPHKGTENLGHWFSGIFSHLKLVPRFLIPCYFDAIVTGAYMVLMETSINLMSDFVKDGSHFVKALSMTSLQLVGYCCQARLPFLSPKLLPQPRQEFNNHTKKLEQAPLSMSAGFPHFSAGYMRNWGRDTFIALRGMLIITGRHMEARNIILAYAGTLRHGLIPNLLNQGTMARFNCRDAVWFWLQAIQEYCINVPNGYAILNMPVSRLYPNDDSSPQDPGVSDQPLHQVMQEALKRHACGVKFRERDAGLQIDEHMADGGFNNEVGVDWSTGFVFGGNQWNCGTWMDKMGSSVKAGNKGKPATPRDGSAVELVGLCASTVKWLAEASERNIYPHKGVEAIIQGNNTNISFNEWFKKIESSFESKFFIPVTPDSDSPTETNLINTRGIYKDSFKASQTWPDFQFRCNFPVVMVTAPSLFTPEKAWVALETMGNILLGPLGMKTLTPHDWKYRGDYHNDDNSDDINVANGWNYHQGPEWVWPVGYFLRAKLHFAKILEKSRPGILEKTKLYINSVLSKHYQQVLNSPWQGLPELTNSNGQYCPGSCQTQAWSNGTILEVLYDLAKLEE